MPSTALTILVLTCACSSPKGGVVPAASTSIVKDAGTDGMSLEQIQATVAMMLEGVGVGVLPSKLCHDSLCTMDSYCSCHGDRCWTAPDDCEVDAACCSARAGYCNGLRLDECADETVKARKVRDGQR